MNKRQTLRTGTAILTWGPLCSDGGRLLSNKELHLHRPSRIASQNSSETVFGHYCHGLLPMLAHLRRIRVQRFRSTLPPSEKHRHWGHVSNDDGPIFVLTFDGFRLLPGSPHKTHGWVLCIVISTVISIEQLDGRSLRLDLTFVVPFVKRIAGEKTNSRGCLQLSAHSSVEGASSIKFTREEDHNWHSKRITD